MDSIATERLMLRNFRSADAAGLFAYLHAPRVNCFLSNRLATLQEAETEATKRSTSDDHIAVCLKTTDGLIGDLLGIADEPDTFGVGWHFNAEFAGAGYALEAARALFAHLFTAKQARRLYAYVEDTNRASQRLCEKLKMRKEGVFVEYISFTHDAAGHPVYENTMQYAILRKEWTM